MPAWTLTLPSTLALTRNSNPNPNPNHNPNPNPSPCPDPKPSPHQLTLEGIRSLDDLMQWRIRMQEVC